MKTLAIYGIIVASAVGVGVGGGALIKREFTEPEKDYSGFDVSVYNINEDELIEKVEGYTNKQLAYSALTPVDLVNYALVTYKRFENSYSFGYGLADTVVAQDIRNACIKNGDVVFEESVSKSSIVGVANRYIQRTKGGDVELYAAPENGPEIIIDSAVCGYGKTPTIYTADKYRELYGRTPHDMFNYIIHKDSIVSSEKKVLDSGDYEFTLIADPDIATYNYQFQMETLSHLSKKPSFSSCKLTFVTSKDFVLKNLTTDEVYTAVMGFPATINSHIEYTYFAGEYYKIPEINENFDYVGLINGGK